MAQTINVIVGAEDHARLAAILGDRNHRQGIGFSFLET
jgi:hypothetical protein